MEPSLGKLRDVSPVSHRSLLPLSVTACERPIPLVVYKPFKYVVNVEDRHFLVSELQDMPLSVVAVTGRSARGKSMVLNYLLRYANFRYGFNQREDEWLKEGDLPCEGWKWKGDDETLGISIWSDLFIWQDEDETKGAIVILSTDGLTKSNAETAEAHAILALAALCSSVQVHTIQRKIQGDDLNDVELASMCATMIASKTHNARISKEDQNLICVVTDWSQEKDIFGALGFTGGSNYFKQEETRPRKSQAHDHIKEYYSDFRVFLLPESSGSLKSASAKFKGALKELVESILSPDKVNFKTINGRHLRVGELLEIMESWTSVLNGPDVPVVHLCYDTSVHLQTVIAKEAAYREYNRSMVEVFSSKRRFSKDRLEVMNRRAVKCAVVAYKRVPKLNRSHHLEDMLKQELAMMYTAYADKNQRRTAWYHHARDRGRRMLTDSAYIVWLIMFLVYSGMERYYPNSRFVRVLHRNYVAFEQAFVISYLMYMLYAVVLND